MTDSELIRRFMAGESIEQLRGDGEHIEIRLRAICVGMNLASENMENGDDYL